MKNKKYLHRLIIFISTIIAVIASAQATMACWENLGIPFFPYQPKVPKSLQK
jgi:hypothetical protein